MPGSVSEDSDYSLVESLIQNYWMLNKNQVLEFETNLTNLIGSNEAKVIFTQMQNYMLSVIKANSDNKQLFYRVIRDLSYVEDAKRQIGLTPAMNIQTVVENLSFKMIL